MKKFSAFFLILFNFFLKLSCFQDDEMKRLFKVEVLKEGDDATYSKKGNKIVLHYTGTFLETKRKFESSYDKQKPATIVIGKQFMIECWERVIPKISLHEKIYFVCPHSLAYGIEGVKGKVPPKMNLAYEVEILEIIDGNYDEL